MQAMRVLEFSIRNTTRSMILQVVPDQVAAVGLVDGARGVQDWGFVVAAGAAKASGFLARPTIEELGAARAGAVFESQDV
jgi:hypothetical protein